MTRFPGLPVFVWGSSDPRLVGQAGSQGQILEFGIEDPPWADGCGIRGPCEFKCICHTISWDLLPGQPATKEAVDQEIPMKSSLTIMDSWSPAAVSFERLRAPPRVTDCEREREDSTGGYLKSS